MKKILLVLFSLSLIVSACAPKKISAGAGRAQKQKLRELEWNSKIIIPDANLTVRVPGKKALFSAGSSNTINAFADLGNLSDEGRFKNATNYLSFPNEISIKAEEYFLSRIKQNEKSIAEPLIYNKQKIDRTKLIARYKELKNLSGVEVFEKLTQGRKNSIIDEFILDEIPFLEVNKLLNSGSLAYKDYSQVEMFYVLQKHGKQYHIFCYIFSTINTYTKTVYSCSGLIRISFDCDKLVNTKFMLDESKIDAEKLIKYLIEPYVRKKMSNHRS